MIHLGIFCKFSRGLIYIYVPACVFWGGGLQSLIDFDSLAKKYSFLYLTVTNMQHFKEVSP